MSHMNKSYPIWMSHVPYEWVMSHINASCHIWIWLKTLLLLVHDVHHQRVVSMSWVMSHVNESCPIWTSHVPYECVMSHMNDPCIHMGHDSFIWDIRCIFGTWLKTLLLLVQDIFTTGSWRASWYTSRIDMSHLKYTWAMSHLNKVMPMSHMNQSRHTWTSIANESCLHMNESCEWVTSHVNELCERATKHTNLSRLRINQSCLYTNESRLDINESGHVCKRRSYIWMSHITHKSVMSTHKWVVWISRVMWRTNESRHIWISHVKEPCHTQTSHVKYEWVMSHMNESCHINQSCHL